MRHINFKKLILVLSIIIVLNLFFNYGIKTFYHSPNHDDFCKPEIMNKTYSTQQDCQNIGGLWSDNPVYGIKTPSGLTEPKGYCNQTFTCQNDYEGVREIYDRNVFIVLIIAGILSIVAGFLIAVSEAVSLGLSFGGLLSLLIGTIRYWSGMNDYLRFVILGAALIILVWLGIKKFKDNEGV
jgi:hypothetical protein